MSWSLMHIHNTAPITCLPLTVQKCIQRKGSEHALFPGCGGSSTSCALQHTLRFFQIPEAAQIVSPQTTKKLRADSFTSQLKNSSAFCKGHGNRRATGRAVRAQVSLFLRTLMPGRFLRVRKRLGSLKIVFKRFAGA